MYNCSSKVYHFDSIHDRRGLDLFIYMTKPNLTETARIADFMRHFVRQQQKATEYDAWFYLQVQKGLNAANVGDVVSA